MKLIEQLKKNPLTSGPWIKEVDLKPSRLRLRVLIPGEDDEKIIVAGEGLRLQDRSVICFVVITTEELEEDGTISMDVIHIFGVQSWEMWENVFDTWAHELSDYWHHIRNLAAAIQFHPTKEGGIVDGPH